MPLRTRATYPILPTISTIGVLPWNDSIEAIGVQARTAFEENECLGCRADLAGNAALLQELECIGGVFSTVAVQTGVPYHEHRHGRAVEGLTRTLAAEWSPAIRVNCIAPS